jgi:NAD(P)H-hydrate epimerase
VRKAGGFTYVTADEMKEIDRAAIEDYGVDVLSLMENAGVAVASHVKRFLGDALPTKHIGCLTGKGNNGGDGLVAARHLANWGAKVSVVLASPKDDFGAVAAKQLKTAEAMGILMLEAEAGLEGFDILLDALLGYNAKGPPRERTASIIRRANDSEIPIVAVDIPSGLDPTTGSPNEPTIIARATVALGLPKTGFLNPESRRFVGELYLGDVSIPRPIYSERLLQAAPFAGENLVRIF